MTTSQLDRVRFWVSNGEWYTLEALSSFLSYPEASISARLRDLRKPRFGGYTVERRRVKGQRGLWEYRVLRTPEQLELM